MELLVIGVLLLAAIWFFNFDRPLMQVADMANREVAAQNASHKTKTVKKLGKLDLTADEVTKAKAVLAALDSFDL